MKVVCVACLLIVVPVVCFSQAPTKKNKFAVVSKMAEPIEIGSQDLLPDKQKLLALADTLTSSTSAERADPFYFRQYQKLRHDARLVAKDLSADEAARIELVPEPSTTALSRVQAEQVLERQRQAEIQAGRNADAHQANEKRRREEEYAQREARRIRQQKLEALARKREQEKRTWGPDEFGDRAREFLFRQGEE